MLKITQYRSPEVQEYIEGHLIQYIGEDAPIVIQHADLGYRLTYKYKFSNEESHSFIGERIPGFENYDVFVYINKDALFFNDLGDPDWSTVSYGYSDIDIAYCRSTYCKDELLRYIDDKAVDLSGQNVSLADKAITAFLDSVDVDNLTVDKIIQKMIETKSYPFMLIPKKVVWLN